MTRICEHDELFERDQRALFEQLEEFYREAAHRATGGFKTQDQQFARQAEENTLTVLQFLDRTVLLVDDILRSSRHEVDETNLELERANEKLDKVDEFVKLHSNLQLIAKILKE